MVVTWPTSHALRSSSNVPLPATSYRSFSISVTALTSHAEIGPCVACAAAASAHHSPSAAWRLSLLLNIGGSGGGSEGGVVGGSGGESGGGSGGGEAGGKAGTGGAGGCNGGSGGSEGVAQVTEAQSLPQIEGIWASKLVWILSLLQSLKAFAELNIYCAAPRRVGTPVAK